MGMTDETRIREVVTEVWSEVLGVSVDQDSDFFLLGGHSLLATQMFARLKKALGVKLSLRDLLENGALGEFTDLVILRSETLAAS